MGGYVVYLIMFVAIAYVGNYIEQKFKALERRVKALEERPTAVAERANDGCLISSHSLAS